MADLATALGNSLVNSTNSPGLASNVFSYPGAGNGVASTTPATPSLQDELGNNTPAVDPNAAANAAAAAANAAKMDGINAQHKGILDSVSMAEDVSGDSYKTGILDYLDGLRASQNTIDNKGVQAELAKRQGMDAVNNYVGDGIRSEGALLGNKNASSSSAAEAIARAYATLGTRQAQGVNTQYGQDENDINTDQNNLAIQTSTQARHNDESKASSVKAILGDATNRLSYLDSMIAGASLPDRINLEAEKAQIQADTQNKLNQYDHLFTEGVAGITPSDTNTRVAKAAALATSGVAATKPYDLTTEAPAQFAGTGGFSSDLPIFTAPRKLVA